MELTKTTWGFFHPTRKLEHVLVDSNSEATGEKGLTEVDDWSTITP